METAFHSPSVSTSLTGTENFQVLALASYPRTKPGSPVPSWLTTVMSRVRSDGRAQALTLKPFWVSSTVLPASTQLPPVPSKWAAESMAPPGPGTPKVTPGPKPAGYLPVSSSAALPPGASARFHWAAAEAPAAT
ncbi:hypothetical protein GCM10020254_55520 [Streptomyces goshikiensis]